MVRQSVAASALVLVTIVVSGCPGGGPPPTVPASDDPPAVAIVTPAAPSAPPPTPELQQPPGATLDVAGTRWDGRLGSWTWGEAGEDAPWLPAPALPEGPVLPPRSRVGVILDGPVLVESWTAVAARAFDTAADELVDVGSGAGSPSFVVPPGDWVVQVHLVFAERRGEASWYWRVVAR